MAGSHCPDHRRVVRHRLRHWQARGHFALPGVRPQRQALFDIRDYKATGGAIIRGAQRAASEVPR